MFYTFKNSKIQIDGRELIAESVNLSHSSTVEAFYEQGDRYNSSYVATDAQRGSFQVSYYLTGEDFIKDYIDNETGSFSGNFGGLYFESGYLESYSIQGSPNTPVIVSLNGVFFDKIYGTFSPTYGDITKNDNYYNFADSSITVVGSEIGSLSETESYSYSVQNSVIPVYYQNSIFPDRIHFDRRRSEMTISSSNLSSDLGLTGQRGGATLLFTHPEGGTLGTYSCSGRMISKNLSISVGSKIQSQIRIISEFYSESPSITSISPTPSTLTVGDSFIANGSGLRNSRRLLIGDREVTNFTVISDSQVSGVIPNDAVSGNLTIFSYGGSDSIDFGLTDTNISISSVSPSSGVAGENFTISGDGFYRISNVRLVEDEFKRECDFEVLSNSIISATAPSNFGGYNLLTEVYTSGNGRDVQSGVLSDSYSILPTIIEFTPTGAAGDFFIVQTYGHQGFNKIIFNDGPSYDTAGDSSYNYLTGLVPEGDTFGKIKLNNPVAGVSVESTQIFYPKIGMSGVSPTSGREGDLVTLTGTNFYTGLLYPTRLNHYLADYNGSTGEMKWISNSGLSGQVPEMTDSGPVRLFSNNGSLYENSISFTYIPPLLNLTGIDPITSSGDATIPNKIRVLGENLTFSNSVYLTKTDNPSLGSVYYNLTGNGTGIGVGLLGTTATFYVSGSDSMPTGTYDITMEDPYSSDTISDYTLY